MSVSRPENEDLIVDYGPLGGHIAASAVKYALTDHNQIKARSIHKYLWMDSKKTINYCECWSTHGAVEKKGLIPLLNFRRSSFNERK